ncbi:DUF4426 domain-containing protein [Arhodomonas sp. AD133]|uniref:DUF4426 domain-containing protein n=1 Tax=Arhodomonas sp. AD133 TaxID=3415009 RepID=UPI003EBFD559
MPIRAVLRIVAVVVLTAVALPANAERLRRFGDYEIHYNAIATATLTPEVARAYDLVRSRGRALVTASVLRNGDPVAATIEASAENEVGQRRTIRMRKVAEGTAIYYIGTTPVSPPERLRVELRVHPAGTAQTHALTFTQWFYPEQ